MEPRERLRAARLAYMRALARSRSDASPSAWRRLVTARRNLSAAIREVEGAAPGHDAAAADHPVA